MKKLMMSLMTVCMLLSVIPVQLKAETTPTSNPTAPHRAPASPEVTAMVSRLHEIRDMDMSALGKAEKKQLRQEVKTIKTDLKAANQGVYLSVGAILIVILLLILLL